MASGNISRNPLLRPWDTPFGPPPFALIKPEHFPPAIEHGMARALAGYRALADGLRTLICSAGGRRDTTKACVSFRGAMPDAAPLPRKRGLYEAA